MKKLLLLAVLSFASLSASAADHVVNMLNSGPDGVMSFDPGFLQIAAGDTVTFVAKDGGHNSESFFTPEGATAWKGDINKDISVTFDKPGIYLYKCMPHFVMAMVGAIQVGEASNLDAAKTAAAEASKMFALSKDRLSNYLALAK